MPLEDLFGVSLPIIQAPMAGSQDGLLAAAVSEAGGLGSLPCAMLDADAIRRQVREIRARTSNPVNVNFFCHTPPTPDPERESAWRTMLSPYFAELGIDPNKIAPGAGRRPFSYDLADVLGEVRPEVVSFHFGLPKPELLDRVRAIGAKVLSTATTVAEAQWLEAHGVDAVIAQGFEAGGHRGNFLSGDLNLQISTFALVPQIVAAIKIPVIAAGGIADAPGVAAALALGAAGVQIGTAYLLCSESKASAVHRAALKSDARSTTAITNLFSGRPARGIVNRLMCELGPINPAAPEFPLAGTALAPLRAKAESEGRGDFSPLWAGQNTSGCREVSAAALTQELAAGIKPGRPTRR
jgi:nitronate monooxygenase